MSQKRYIVRLTQEERDELGALIGAERVARKKRMRAQVLFKVDEGEHGPAWSDAEAAEAFDVHINTVHSIRKDLVLLGLERALQRKQPDRPARTPVFDEKKEEELLAVAAGEPPEGHARWTLRLLAKEVVQLDIVESVCHETVRKVLKKKICSHTVR